MKDVSFLIDFLPAFLFPAGERTITDFFISGQSPLLSGLRSS